MLQSGDKTKMVILNKDRGVNNFNFDVQQDSGTSTAAATTSTAGTTTAAVGTLEWKMVDNVYKLIYTSAPIAVDYSAYGTTTGTAADTTTGTMPAAGADATTGDIAAESLTIYAENSSNAGAMNAFQNYGGIGLFVNTGMQYCQADFYQAPLDVGTSTM